MNTIPLSSPDITDLEIDAVAAVLRSSRLSLGPRMEEFEARLAAHTGVPHGIAVSSGTAGLHLCLLALGIRGGDEVIVPSFTFIAAANVIRYVNAVPVFVDIDPSTLNMDPAQVEAAITPRTRALLVVHTFGRPADLAALVDIAHRHGLRLIEDACEALGAHYAGKPVGSFGDAAVFAFYPNKQITTGEGGMVVTRDPLLAREIRALRNQGRYESDPWSAHSILGYNYRLSELNCALGCVQMSRLDEILALRRNVAELYNRHLGAHPRLTLPAASAPHERISWFVYVVLLHPDLAHRRDAILPSMQAAGIQCGRYFASIHQQPAYAAIAAGRQLGVTESVSSRTIALPFFNRLTDGQVHHVATTLQMLLSNSPEAPPPFPPQDEPPRRAPRRAPPPHTI